MSNLALIEKMIQPTLDEQTLDIIIKAKPKDKEILARTIFGEAANQGEEGMTAVGNVILNRYRSNLPKYKTKDFEGIKSVILKPYAFTVYNDKKDENYNRMMSATKENESYAKALDIAEKLLTGNENPFNNKVIIIDEAHNFVTRIVNKIKRKETDSLSFMLYDALLKAKSPEERRTLRSKTFKGIAMAMADQWYAEIEGDVQMSLALKEIENLQLTFK